MTTPEQALADPRLATVYGISGRVSLKRIREAATHANRALYALDGATITDKASFLRACAAVLAFPPYFGQNWDALHDCLTDLSWLPPQGRVILYHNTAAFRDHSPADWEVAADIFRVAARYWYAKTPPLWVLLHDKGGAPLLPLLSPRA